MEAVGPLDRPNAELMMPIIGEVVLSEESTLEKCESMHTNISETVT